MALSSFRLELPFVRQCLSTATPAFMVSVFSLINILNFVDRGIVPGAFESIGAFIRADLGVCTTDFYIGVLQSTYIVGFALACVTFGHATHYVDPFKLICLGLAIWVGAMALSATAPSYWVLVLARVLSGAGEGSFQTVVPPYIDDHAPPAKRGLWLALFFCGIPVGTALGNVYGGFISTALSWRWAFALVGVVMVPFILIVWHAPSPHRAAAEATESASAAATAAATAATATAGAPGEEQLQSLTEQHNTNIALASAALIVGEKELAKALRNGGSGRALAAARQQQQQRLGSLNAAPDGSPAGAAEDLSSGSYARLLEDDSQLAVALPPTAAAAAPKVLFTRELLALLTDPLFMCITLGYAGFAAVLAGLASFGPSICAVSIGAALQSLLLPPSLPLAPPLSLTRTPYTHTRHALTPLLPTGPGPGVLPQ